MKDAEALSQGMRPVKSAERTLAVLETLAGWSGPMPVAELHRASGYPRSSLHQLLRTMESSGWIEVSPDGSYAAIGSRALVVGTAYLDRDRALPYALAALERIRDKTGYTTHYARLEGDHVLYLATRETTQSRRATSRVGRQLPAHATALGKALLAELSDAERAARLSNEPLVALTPDTIVDRAAFARQLVAAREIGYAVEHGESLTGVTCVGVVVGYRIPATDAVSCSIPNDRAGDDELERVASILRTNAEQLAASLRAAGIR